MSEHIPEIIAMIETLVERGHAYAVSGNVFYDVTSFPEYGKLSNQKLDQLQAGTRFEVDPDKKHPMDFALWKKQNLMNQLRIALGAEVGPAGTLNAQPCPTNISDLNLNFTAAAAI